MATGRLHFGKVGFAGYAFALIALSFAWSLLLAPGVSAQVRNLTVQVYGPSDFANVWLGISGGGYQLIAEKGKPFTFEIFVKNGMPNASMTNLEIAPREFPFPIEGITPKKMEMIKPMEIVRFVVTTTIPADSQQGYYNYAFDVSSDQFPIGIFTYSDRFKVVDNINYPLYGAMAFISVAIIAVLLWRKYQLSRQ
jgi:uncharacterized membrane protein